MSRRGAFTVALVAALATPIPASAIDVLLRLPPAGKPAFAGITIEAEVLAAEPIAEVVFRVDGEEVGRLSEPPWKLDVDLGEVNAEHLFEVTARTASGAEATGRRETPKVRVDEAIDLQLQQLFVTVQRGSDFDLGLGQDAFRIFDVRQPQTIVTFERGDAPMTAVVLLDTSNSMRRGNNLSTAIEAAKEFFTGLRELDEAMLVLFSDRRIHANGFSPDPEELAFGLGEVEAGGGTALNDHLYFALRLLDSRQGRRMVIVLSDGEDADSVLSAEDVRWAARRSGSLIYWIRLQDVREPGTYASSWRNNREHAKELKTLEHTVEESGGAIFPIADVGGAEQAFRDILTELRSQYVLGYYPSRNLDDGSWHPVRVLVRGAGRVRTRDGYIDY